MNSPNNLGDSEAGSESDLLLEEQDDQNLQDDLSHRIKLANAIPLTVIFIIVSLAGWSFEIQLESAYSDTIAISLLPDSKETNEEEQSLEAPEINPNTQKVADSIYQAIISGQLSADLVDPPKDFLSLARSEQLISIAITIKSFRKKKYYDEGLALLVGLTQQEQESLNLIFTKAYILAKLGHNSAAIISYEVLLSKQPEHQSANINLGLLYLEEQRYVKAETVFSKGVSNTAATKKAKNYSGLGEAQYALKKYQLAVASFQKSIEYRPSYALSWRNLAKSAIKSGQHKLALDSFKKTISLDKNNVRSRVEFADYLNGRLDFQEAVAQLKVAKKIERESFSIRLALAFSYLQNGKPINAKKQLNFAKKSVQRDTQKRQSDAIQKILSEKFRDAVKLLRINLKKNRNNNFEYYLLARSYIELKKPKTAIIYINKISPDSPYYFQAKYLLAEVHVDNKRIQEAVTVYREIVSVIDDNVQLLTDAANVEQQALNYQQAITLIDKALEIRKNRRLLLRKADLKWLMDDKTAALQALTELVEQYPTYLRAIYHLADYNQKMGNSEVAIGLFSNLLAQRETYGDAQYQLAVIYFGQQVYPQSQTLLAAYLQRKPDSKRTRLLYARTFCETDQFQICIEQLELVLKLSPNYAPALELLASTNNNS